MNRFSAFFTSFAFWWTATTCLAPAERKTFAAAGSWQKARKRGWEIMVRREEACRYWPVREGFSRMRASPLRERDSSWVVGRWEFDAFMEAAVIACPTKCTAPGLSFINVCLTLASVP